MAETPKKSTAGTKASPGGKAKKSTTNSSAGRSPSKSVTATVKSKAPAKKSSAAKNGKSAAKPTSKTSSTAKGEPKQTGGDKSRQAEQLRIEEERRAERAARRDAFSKQFLPYILGGVSLFLMVCLVADAFSGNAAPGDHAMGYVGYYLCHTLFGLLGFVAYLIPLVLVTLTIFWRRYYRTGRVVGKVILSVILLVLLSAVGHVFLCEGNDLIAGMYQPASLFRTGAVFESGGVIGGLVGYVLYLAIRLPGTIVLAVVSLPLILMSLLGITPGDVFGRIWASVKHHRAKAAERASEEEEPAPTQSYRARRASGRAASRSNGEDEDEDTDDIDNANDYEDEEDDTEDIDDIDDAPAALPLREASTRQADSTRKNGPKGVPKGVLKDRKIVRLDTETGELLDDEDESAVMSAPATSKSGKVSKKSGAAAVSEEEPEETAGVLPLFDHSSAPTPEASEDPGDPGDPGDDAVSTVEIVAAERLSSGGKTKHGSVSVVKPVPADEDETLPWAEGDASADGINDTEMDSMEVDFDEEADEDEETAGTDEDEAAPPARRVNYQVVGDAGEASDSQKNSAGVVTTVRILKSETGAVAEHGLSEEELVLPSGHGHSEEGAHAETPELTREYQFPSVDMLTRGSGHYEANEEEIAENTETLREVLESFHIRVKDISCSCGPTITRFEVRPESGVRVRSIANLVDDIAMNLAKAGVRIEAPIPGKNAVGIEVPNSEPSTVHLRNILETPEFRNHKSRIAACLGADVSGRPVIMDINKMPHLLIAGATGMGKSVCINSIIMSILFKARPDEVKLILIDPKKVEFAMYRDLPHLYAPIVSDPKKAAGALNSAVNEMERRFELIEEVGVRNLAGYNEITAGDPERPPMPQMVIIIDELADLMMTAPADVETAICRLAQKARAAGIHLIIGTQRPSVDVITGLIKANIPSRIAFTVASAVDSRTIIDSVGADKLIGRGDMLYSPVGATKPMRAQGTFVSETEVERVVTFIKENNEPPEYNEDFTRNIDIEAAKCGAGKKKGGGDADDFAAIGARNDGEDPKFWEALEIVVTKDKIGTSALQRGCQLGYGRAAKIIDRMEELGFIGPDDGTKQGRKVYITKQNLVEYKLNGLPGSHAGDRDGDCNGDCNSEGEE